MPDEKREAHGGPSIATLTAEQKLQQIREIIESAPSCQLGPDPNKIAEPLPLSPDFFTTRPGFWDKYAGVKQ